VAFCKGSNAQIFDIRTGDLLADLRSPATEIFFSPEGDLFGVFRTHTEEDITRAEVFVRNLQTGHETLRRPFNPLGADWFPPFRRFRAISGGLAAETIGPDYPKLQFWDMAKGRPVGKELPSPDSYVGFCPATATLDNRFVAYFMGTEVCFFDLKTDRTWTMPLAPGWQDSPSWPINHAGRLSCDGRTIAVTLYNPGSSQRLWFHKLLAHLGIDMGKYWNPQTCVKLYDTASGKELHHFADAHCGALSHDGKTLALAKDKDNQIELWDLEPWPPRFVLMLVACAMSVVTFAIATWWKRRRKAVEAVSTVA
jgi:hypothetical protein